MRRHLPKDRPKLLRAVLFALCLLVLVAVPTRYVGVADGLPADHPLDLWIAFLLAGGFFVLPWRMEPRKALRLSLALLLVAFLKLSLAATSLPHGLMASYYANADFEGPPEASIEYRLPGATRIDRNLDFAPVGFAWGKKPFPLWFFNDKRRFNYYRPGEPDRHRLPFSVRWEGVVRAPTEKPLHWRLATEQDATLAVDGKPLLSTAGGESEASLALEGGWHPIIVTYVWRGLGPRSLKLEWALEGGDFEPVPSSALLPNRPSPRAEAWEKRTAKLAWWVFALQFLVAAWAMAAGLGGLTLQAFRSEKVALYLVLLVMVALGTISLGKRGREPNWNILNGGDDPLLYEGSARQIVIERDLLNKMKWVESDGQRKSTIPFYNMVGYRYYLAGTHLLLGESKAMVVMSHYFLLAIACALLYYLFRAFIPPGPSLLAAAMLFAGQAHGTVYGWATELFPAILGLALVAGVLLSLSQWDARPTSRGGAALGLLMGLAILVRPNVIVFLPLALGWMVMAGKAQRTLRWKGAATALLITALIIAPVTGRNWYTSGRFVLLIRSGPTMLFEGNTPPPDSVDYSGITDDPFYEKHKLSPEMRKVLEFLRQRPWDFIKGWGRKTLQTLGLFNPLAPSLVMLHMGYLAGAVLLWRKGVARRLSVLLHGFVLSQWVLLVIVKPGPHLPKTQLPTFIVAFGFASVLIVSLLYAALAGHLPASLFQPEHRWGRTARVLAATGGLGLLASITYPPRLPLIALLLLWSVWSLRRDSRSLWPTVLDELREPSLLRSGRGG